MEYLNFLQGKISNTVGLHINYQNITKVIPGNGQGARGLVGKGVRHSHFE